MLGGVKAGEAISTQGHAFALAAIRKTRHEERAVRADAHDRVRRLPERADRRRVHAAHLREGPLRLEVGRCETARYNFP